MIGDEYRGPALIFGHATAPDQSLQNMIAIRNVACFPNFVSTYSLKLRGQPVLLAKRWFIDDQPEICLIPSPGVTILEHPVPDILLAHLLSTPVIRISAAKFQSISQGLQANQAVTCFLVFRCFCCTVQAKHRCLFCDM